MNDQNQVIWNDQPSQGSSGQSGQTIQSGQVNNYQTTYDNTETVEFPDGFDPVTLMPRKIVIHRNAKVAK
jgi:hypothetical protein